VRLDLAFGDEPRLEFLESAVTAARETTTHSF